MEELMSEAYTYLGQYPRKVIKKLRLALVATMGVTLFLYIFIKYAQETWSLEVASRALLDFSFPLLLCFIVLAVIEFWSWWFFKKWPLKVQRILAQTQKDFTLSQKWGCFSEVSEQFLKASQRQRAQDILASESIREQTDQLINILEDSRFCQKQIVKIKHDALSLNDRWSLWNRQLTNFSSPFPWDWMRNYVQKYRQEQEVLEEQIFRMRHLLFQYVGSQKVAGGHWAVQLDQLGAKMDAQFEKLKKQYQNFMVDFVERSQKSHLKLRRLKRFGEESVVFWETKKSDILEKTNLLQRKVVRDLLALRKVIPQLAEHELLFKGEDLGPVAEILGEELIELTNLQSSRLLGWEEAMAEILGKKGQVPSDLENTERSKELLVETIREQNRLSSQCVKANVDGHFLTELAV